MGGAELDLCDAELSNEAIAINVYTLIAPVIHLRLISVMGGGEVRRGRKRGKRGQRREDRELEA
jgi:hypothetical protein